MSRTSEHIIIAFVFVALAFAAWVPHSLHPDTSITDPWDGCLNAWILNWNFHWFASGCPGGPAGYFNGNIMYPHSRTLAFSEHMLGVALAAAPLRWIAGSGGPLRVFNWLQILSFAACAMAMYLFAARIGMPRAAAFAAGIMWSFSPWRYSQHGHFQLLSFYWMPLTLWALIAWFQTGRRRWLVTAALTHLMQILSSYYLAVFHGTVLALFAIAVLCVEPVPGARKRLIYALIALTVASLPLIPVSIPYFELENTLSLAAADDTVRSLSATPAMYLLPRATGPFYSRLHRVVGTGTGGWFPSEQQVFPGFLVLVFALLSIRPRLPDRRKRRRSQHPDRNPWIATIAVFSVMLIGTGFILSLGPGSENGPTLPFHWLSLGVPGFKVVRVPARFAVLVQTGLALAAGMGLGIFIPKHRFGRHFAAIAGILVFLETAVWPAPSTRIAAGSEPPVPYNILAAEPGGGPVAEFPFEHRKYREMLYACYHWRPLVNGTSGYLPPGRTFIEHHLKHFPGGRSLDLLACLGVRDLVIHDNQPEWNHGAAFRGDFRLIPRAGSDTGRLYELSISPPAPPEPVVLCDMPRHLLADTRHLMRLHLINPGDHALLFPDAEMIMSLRLTPRNIPPVNGGSNVPAVSHTVTITRDFPAVIPPGAVWTAEHLQPACPANTSYSYACEWTVTGILGRSGRDSGAVAVVNRLETTASAAADTQSIEAVYDHRVIRAGEPFEITFLLENNTDSLWPADSRLVTSSETLDLQWVPEHLYPAQSACDNLSALHSPATTAANPTLAPRSDVMPGMTAFCPLELIPPPWPGQYRLTLNGRPMVRYVFLGPERAVPAGTSVILHQNPGSAGHLTDGCRDTVWDSAVPVYADTAIHLDFKTRRRVQGFRLYAADPPLPVPESPSVLVSDDGNTWQRIIPESRWNATAAAQEIWFPPRITRHIAVHAGVMMHHPWSISEITLF